MPLLILLIIIKNFSSNFNLFLYIIWNILLFVALYYFHRITEKSYLKLKQNKRSDNLLNLIVTKNIDINNYCPKCNIDFNGCYIKHCYICDQCIEDFDHHCIWIGKCIGKNNKNLFLLLLILILMNFIINTLICIIIEPIFNKKYKIINHKLKNENMVHILFLVNIINLIFGSYIILPLIKNNFKKGYNNIYSFNSFLSEEKNKNENINNKTFGKFKERLLNDM